MSARLSDEAFAAVRDHLAAAAGLAFDESRRAGLSVVVAERVRSSGAAGIEDYLGLLRGRDGEEERQRLLDGVTVQETHFFRNAPQMEALRRRVLPELLRRAAQRERPLTIWSAGCSTGEEAYTLAMLLLDLAAAPGSAPPARIVATDVSGEAVRAARRATYAGRTLDLVPAIVRDRWFESRPGGASVVRDRVRALVDVRLHNLVTEPPPFAPGEVDLIVCRNVTIYFSRPTTRLLIGTFHDALAEGGYLLLGHSETLWQVSDAFTLVPVGEAFVYRRTHDGRGQGVLPSPVAARRRNRPVGNGRRPAVGRELPVPAPRAAAVPSAGDLLAAARAALAAGDYRAAAEQAQAAASADTLTAEAYVVLGQARSTLGLDQQALDPLRKAVYLDPLAGHAHFLLAGSLARVGQHAAAAVSYRAAARALPAVAQPVLDRYLGGRAVGDLVEVCERLARVSAELDADAALLASARGAS